MLFLLLTLLFPLGTCGDSISASHAADQIGIANFTSVFGVKDEKQPCLVEFYASWCPACKHFAPTFEKLAVFLKDKQLGDKLLYIARVDCASEIKLCGLFDISGYPALFVGYASDFRTRDKKNLQELKGSRELQSMAAWVGAFFGTELRYSEVASSSAKSTATAPAQIASEVAVTTTNANPTTTPVVTETKSATSADTGGEQPARKRPLPAGPEWSVADVEGATLQLWAIIAGTPRLHKGPEKRLALSQLLEGWATAHPSASCKTHSARLLSSYDTLWPPSEEEAPDALLHSEPCGPPAGLSYTGQWVTCRGSLPDSRGYSCGLWELLHTMALRLPESGESGGPAPGSAMLSFLTTFNTHFFLCEPCQRHFGRILSTPEAAALSDRRSLSLWLWRVHNEVNERLRGIETRYGHSTSGDPEFPKEQWPSPEVCPRCGSSSSGWDEVEVWEHLVRAFGPGSAPGADGGRAVTAAGGASSARSDLGRQLDPGGKSSRAGLASYSSLQSLLPLLGVAAVVLLLYVVVRGNVLPGRRRGGGMQFSR